MRNKVSNILWGLFFVAIGIGIGGDALDLWSFQLFFKGWWTLLIIVPFGISILQNGPSIGNFIGVFVGVLLLLNQRGVVISDMVWKLLIPGIFIIIGLGMLCRNIFFFGRRSGVQSYDGSNSYSAVFSGRRITVDKETFTGCEMNAVFGGLTLDLRNAVIEGNVAIDASAIFGGIDIYLPEGVAVKTAKTAIFGGVSTKQRSHMEGAPTIYLNTTCMFGGVDIK